MMKIKRHCGKNYETWNYEGNLPKHISSNKGLEKALQALGSMREAYLTLTYVRQGQNFQYRNVLVTSMVSNSTNTNQIQIANAIGASRYMIQKALEHHVHVNETWKNLWGGLPEKCHCDMISEGNYREVLLWWETSITMSLIRKDVKWKHMSAKVFKQHPTHYLQKFQVHLSKLYIVWL
jgi:hypothetical protein